MNIARLASLASVIVIVAISVLTIAPNANAEIDGGWYSYYTTEDLCELTIDPETASVISNGLQTFNLRIGTSKKMLSLFEVNGMPSQVRADATEELPDTIGYEDTVGACIFGEIVNLTGLLVKFEVISGPDAGRVFETELGENGTATFPLTNNGALGTDQVRVTAQLPQICLYAMKDVGLDDQFEWTVLSADGCAEVFSVVADSVERVRPVDFGLLPPVTIAAAANVTWIAPPPVVALGAVSVTSFKRCVSHRIRIRPKYSSGMRRARLVVDGRTVKTKTSTSVFILNPSKYKAGKHRYKVVATYDSGTVTSNTGSFSKCRARVSVKRVKPKFAG